MGQLEGIECLPPHSIGRNSRSSKVASHALDSRRPRARRNRHLPHSGSGNAQVRRERQSLNLPPAGWEVQGADGASCPQRLHRVG